MENFAPGLRDTVLTLATTLRVIVYFVCVLGLMLQVQQARADVEGILRPIVRGIVVVALVATLPFWFGFGERIFLAVADTVQAGYTEHPMRTAAKLRETVSAGHGEFSLRRMGESFYQAGLAAAVKLVVLIASVLQVPLLILQYILKLLCFLFLPVALGLFMIPAQAQLATRYVQQSLAVLAWPVGFAVTELVAYHLLTGYGDNLAVAYGLTPGQIDPASYGSILGGLVAALWIIIGTVGTPFLMQRLICSGAPLASGAGAALQQVYALQQLTRLVMALKSGGLAAPLAAGAAAKSSGGPGGGLPPPPPPAPLPPPVAPVAPLDAAGDGRAAAVFSLGRLPAPQTSI